MDKKLGKLPIFLSNLKSRYFHEDRSRSLSNPAPLDVRGPGYQFGQLLDIKQNSQNMSKGEVGADWMDSTIKGGVGGVSKETVDRIEKHIKNNINADLSIEELAEIAGLSVFHFVRQFKVRAGVSPHKFVVKFRMEKAKKLLKETDKPITNIALEVGYGSSSAFTYAFKRHEGTTPTSYRRTRN